MTLQQLVGAAWTNELAISILGDIWAHEGIEPGDLHLSWIADRDGFVLALYDHQTHLYHYANDVRPRVGWTAMNRLDRPDRDRAWFEALDAAMLVVLQARHLTRAHARGGYA